MLLQEYVLNSILAEGVYLFDVMLREYDEEYPKLVGRAIYNTRLKKAKFQVIFPREYDFDEKYEEEELKVEVELMEKLLIE